MKRAFQVDYLFVFTFLFTPPGTMCVLTCRRLTQHVKDELDFDLQLTCLPSGLTEVRTVNARVKVQFGSLVTAVLNYVY